MIIDPMNIDKDKTLCSVEMKYVTKSFVTIQLHSIRIF